MLMLTTSALHDYVYVVCISFTCSFKWPVFFHSNFSHVFRKHIILYGIQSAIKMKIFIVPAAVRKSYKQSAISSLKSTLFIKYLQHPHMRYNLRARTACSNFPRIPTSTTRMRKHYKLTVVNRAYVRQQFWTLAGHVLDQKFILGHFYPKKVMDCSINFAHTSCALYSTVSILKQCGVFWNCWNKTQ